MSSSESNSESDSDISNADDFFDIFSETGSNGFAFEPEYSADEVEERLQTHGEEVSSDEDAVSIEVPGEDGWCTCEQCVQMENAAERVCCQSIAGIIGRKFDSKKCITLTVAFQEVCLSRNVLEAALGTWRHLTEQPLEISNKLYRFIGYRQFISWTYGWLGKDVRKVVPSCVVNKIRRTFPAPDNVYIPYRN